MEFGKRIIKCPFLRRFVSLAVKQGSKETFVPTDEIFEDYNQAVALWTDGNSLHGQTKHLIKKTAFYKERQNNLQVNGAVLSPQSLNAFLLKKRLFLFLQQLKKELEQFANSNNWDVWSATNPRLFRDSITKTSKTTCPIIWWKSYAPTPTTLHERKSKTWPTNWSKYFAVCFPRAQILVTDK